MHSLAAMQHSQPLQCCAGPNTLHFLLSRRLRCACPPSPHIKSLLASTPIPLSLFVIILTSIHMAGLPPPMHGRARAQPWLPAGWARRGQASGARPGGSA